MTNTIPAAKIPTGTVLLHKFQGTKLSVRRIKRTAAGAVESYNTTSRDAAGRLVVDYPAHVLEGLVTLGHMTVVKTSTER